MFAVGWHQTPVQVSPGPLEGPEPVPRSRRGRGAFLASWRRSRAGRPQPGQRCGNPAATSGADPGAEPGVLPRVEPAGMVTRAPPGLDTSVGISEQDQKGRGLGSRKSWGPSREDLVAQSPSLLLKLLVQDWEQGRKAPLLTKRAASGLSLALWPSPKLPLGGS